MGFRPLLLEQGQAVKQRTADTFGFWRGNSPFNPESNAQFGEGGAGAFSDGKLYSQVSDPSIMAARCRGAGGLWRRGDPHGASPPIGTFKLATVVRGLRAQLALR